ncbi:MAG: penicillin-binding transpeptidase domain-containing protein [Thermodesulfobacteriota bacterium]|nr:penicillin-binding transpeptidase domain-containing protein [Thermodesulfobacteriota bacterium]
MTHKRPKTYQINFKGSHWRNYQRKLKRTASINKFIKKMPKYSVVFLFVLVLVCGIISGISGIACHHTQTLTSNTQDNKADIHHSQKKSITKRDIQSLIDSEFFVNLNKKGFGFVFNEQNFRVDTSLDVPLQQFMLNNLDQSTARYIGIVAMDPTTGRILSMVSYDKIDPQNNPCIDNRFPAASIFKIVTASAAIEECNFNSGSILKYNGGKHTLYKSQLKKRTNRYTNRITFRDSFAQSVNPVFGKIGSLYLGKTVLENYAEVFGFNQNIDFEIPVALSSVSLSDEPYQWAEIACGFNHETTLSPLHGALITSVILNHGRLLEPTIVNQITDETGQVIYRSHLITIHQAITPKSAKVVNNLMEATIKSGTCRKAFRGYRKDQILSKLNIGGKSGSIDNKVHDARYDWFVGYAEEKDGHEKLVISVIVAHEKFIGTRASHYARIAMKQYFRNYFAKKDEKVPFKTAMGIDDC